MKHVLTSQHDPAYATPAKDGKAKAKAEAKERAKSKAKAKAAPAAPVVAVIDSDDGGTSSCSDWEEVDTDASTGDDAAVSRVKNNNKKVSFFKGTMFMSSKPRRSVLDRRGKVRKVDVGMLYDSQRTEQVYDCHKARAKAQLMRNMVLQKKKPKLETSQIRVPGSDIIITVVYNRKQDVFFELTPDHAYLKGLPEVREVCMVQPEILKTQMKFIMDTGCAHDLVSQGKVTRNDLETFVGSKTMHFQTANGTTDSDIVARFSTNCFDEPVEAHILESTPSVLSVGKRCVNQGYSFIWPEGRDPYMINQEGQRTQLYVKGDIPYVKVGHEKSSHRHDDEESSEVLKVLNSFKRNDAKDSEIEQPDDAPPVTNGAGEDATPGLDVDGEDVDPGRDDEADDEGIDGEEYEDGEEEAVEDDEIVDEHAEPPVPEIERDEDEVEVDDGEGVPRKAKVGTLKAEANTLSHLCTHRCRNPYFESCIRAKMRHFKTRRGAFKRKIEQWGDLITFDFVDTRDAKDRGVGIDDDTREILVVRDIAKKVVAAYPTASRSTDDVVKCLQRFKGKRKIKMAYSDEAGEFNAAADRLGILLDNSLPGRPRNNSIAERTNQFVLDTTSTCLLQAGLPASYWPYAINCVTHNLNIEDVEGESSWMRMCGDRFGGKAIPFGVKVFFKPTETREPTYGGKFDPKGIPGIFAGYVIGSGHTWSRKYRVWDLADFGSANLGMNAKVPGFLRKPYITEVVVLPEVIEFPLKKEYERMNSSLEGIKEVYELEGKGSKDPKMIPEEERGILDGMTDDEGGDGPDGDGPGGGGAKTKKSIDAPPRPEAPTELPDDPGGGSMKEKEKKSKSSGSEGGEYHIDEAVRELSEGHLYRSKPSSEDDKPPGPSGRTRPRASEEAPDSVMEELRRLGLIKGEVLHWSCGTASDGKIYLNDDGEPCKIDKRGAAYRIGPDGRRSIPTLRPKDKFTPEEWKALGSKGRKIELDIIRDEEKKRKAKESSTVRDGVKLDSKARKKAKKEARKAEKKVKKALRKIRKSEGEHDPSLPVIVPANVRIPTHTNGGAEGWEWGRRLLRRGVFAGFL